MGKQTRQLCEAGGEVGEKTRLLHRWVKNHSPLDTHFPSEPLCLRVQGMCVLLRSLVPPPSPAFLLCLVVAGPQSLTCPCLFSSLPVRLVFTGDCRGEGGIQVIAGLFSAQSSPQFPPSSGDRPIVMTPTPVPPSSVPPSLIFLLFSPLGHTGCDPHPSPPSCGTCSSLCR